ncbi:Uncharacterized protein SCF082_LOCUS10574 [Durusdinium trenchii]|uniref:Sulfotransferase n=1 Tax=Durusdinium trenchii TaxID=1381693 RepID=A0ABP0J7A4_9DINO
MPPRRPGGKYKGLITRTKTDAALAAEADARAKKRQEEVLKRAAMRKQREKMDREGVGPDAVDPEEVRCLNWTWISDEHPEELHERCTCEDLGEVGLTQQPLEGCAAEANAWRTNLSGSGLLGDTAWIAFHMGDERCLVQRCSGTCVRLGDRSPGAVRVTHPYLPSGAGPLPALSSFAPRELCPGGAATILAELGTVSREDGVVPAEVAEIEFQRLFGPLQLRDQAFQSLRFECAADAHRAVADVCLGEKCDEWSKYALPRCQVFLGLPYDFGDSNFLYAPACERSGQFYCPPGLPLALQLTLKAGSRSATVWAAMLEGLMPGIVAVRRTLAVQLGLSEESNKLARYAWEWLEHEETRLGCGGDLAFFSISRGVGMLDQGQIGLPMALCPSCCRRASGRLRVIFLRDPVARMWSFFEGYWFPRKGQLLPEPSFETWLRLILSRNASSSSLFEASDLDHVRPALHRPLGHESQEVMFCMEDVEKSLRRVEGALCRYYHHCTPLPQFPAVKKKKKASSSKPLATLGDFAAGLVRDRFHFDFDALASC